MLNTRPYEGSVLTGILLVFWIYDVFKKREFGQKFYRAAAVFGLMTGVNLLFIGLYNYSVTGNPSILPYALHHARYHRTPLFVFQSLDAPKHDIPPVVRNLDERWAEAFRENYKNPVNALTATVSRIPAYLFWLARSPFLIALFLAGLYFSFRENAPPGLKKLSLIAGFFMVGLFLTTWTGDRFIAPIAGVFIAVSTLCAKIVYRKGEFFRLLILLLPLVIGVGFLTGMSARELKGAPGKSRPDNFATRAQIEDFLNGRPGRDLVFAETSAALPADARFYVYNRAAPAAAEIVWAHRLGPDTDAVLIEHYPARAVWLLKNIDQKAVLVRFDGRNELPDADE